MKFKNNLMKTLKYGDNMLRKLLSYLFLGWVLTFTGL